MGKQKGVKMGLLMEDSALALMMVMLMEPVMGEGNPGQAVALHFDPARLHRFDSQGKVIV
mgnify:CR=1 FL=1